jgi:hypothetical protein
MQIKDYGTIYLKISIKGSCKWKQLEDPKGILDEKLKARWDEYLRGRWDLHGIAITSLEQAMK